uniref:Small ribosomal subunit protein uS3c n=1 Tax=Dunaliella salina TaxID=3046 RepID=D0FY21_DUNSA|nr:ribosomal protein S3 [Dunaliella salina]ACS95107.1 ribosomal protein S3 [Dunaliella salina]
MGQKVHPLGLRVGITKKHQSQWFARFHKNKYAQSVLEDRMLRQTLTQLFPQLLNPVFKKQRDNESSIAPKITQIKIERGLIPYEIGIQIHAENCDLIKSSIENLKINSDFVSRLQKTRRYFQHLRFKLNDSLDRPGGKVNSLEGNVNNEENKIGNVESTVDTSRLKGDRFGKNEGTNTSFRKKGSKFGRLTKSQLRRQRLILKRLKKRQLIRRRYKQLAREARFFLTKNGNKVIQKLTLNKGNNVSNTQKGNRNKGMQKNFNKRVPSKKTVTRVSSKSRVSKSNFGQKPFNIFQSRIKKKFVSIYRNKMNKKFLQVLKSSILALQNSSSFETSNSISKKWNFKLVQPRLAQKPLPKLINLITVLEQKSLKKMESLRKDFITFGTISTASYYQMLKFLKDLKEYVSQIKRKQKLQYTLQNSDLTKRKDTLLSRRPQGALAATSSSVNALMTSNSNSVISKKLNNIENECRKIQLIEYLKQSVKKHRSDNIYLYLSTIAEARKDLRKLKQFTKKHASFLFGTINSEGQNLCPEEQKTKIQERVRLVLDNSHSKADLEKTLQDIFLEQIEKQRNMYIDNVQLTPKIAIKFYSVKEKSVKAKASIVADSVVDALEQRSSFRKIIKKAKEDLMRSPISSSDGKINRVKGVKIQVSGRLNGAEIARSEWVRAGRVPLQTLRANLDYSYKTANTIYGIIGVKVWIFKGYTTLL